MRKFFSGMKVYPLAIVLILGWWLLAFHESREKSEPLSDLHPLKEAEKRVTQIPGILHLERKSLQTALAGDFQMMTELILKWDVDAQILQGSGLIDIQRLSSRDFLRSQWLGRHLTYSSEWELSELNRLNRHQSVVDDLNKTINLDKHYKRFLPQTYAAASFLLALTPIDEIVALPRSLREQSQLYPKVLTDQIALDIDRYNAEKLFLANPELAFVAHYSHPATIQALGNQGVVLYTMKNLDTLPDISDEIVQIGHIINRPLQAELMRIFFESAIMAIDNWSLALKDQWSEKKDHLPRVLFLYYHQKFAIPTLKNLTGQLLRRLGDLDISLKYIEDKEQNGQWMLPIDKESILNLDPDCIIIAVENSAFLENELEHDSAFQSLSAMKGHRVFFVDEAIQQSPCQYIVLAYYDIIQVISKLP